MGVETTTIKFPIGQRYSSRLSLFRLDVEVILFRRVRCSSGAEFSPYHRNDGQLGHFNPYIWEWVDTITLYIQGRRNFSELLIRRLCVRIAPGAPEYEKRAGHSKKWSDCYVSFAFNSKE